MFFARGMAIDINDDMDTLANGGMGLSGPPLDSYIEFLVNVMKAGEPETEWNPNHYYTIPRPQQRRKSLLELHHRALANDLFRTRTQELEAYNLQLSR